MKKRKFILLMLLLITGCDKIESQRKFDEIGDLAIMVQNASGTYEKYDKETWPTTGYQFNPIKSECKNGTKLKWDGNSIIMNTMKSDTCNVYFDKVVTSTTFEYTGQGVEFTPSKNGLYKIELWGASGGDYGGYYGGKGAYTTGIIELNANDRLYIYVGEQGSTQGPVPPFNGGGESTNKDLYGASGGGATDVRLDKGDWKNFNGLKSRIMVAAGGGGANSRNYIETSEYYGAGNGGAGGSLIGENGQVDLNKATKPDDNSIWGYFYGLGGTQIAGGQSTAIGTSIGTDFERWKPFGHFGYAVISQSGGGGGYYAGGGGEHAGAGGGSSYISGHLGCVAISDASSENNIIPKDGCTEENAKTNIECSKHYSNKVFIQTEMKSGNELMPTHDGNDLMLGNTGNGYAKITLIS